MGQAYAMENAAERQRLYALTDNLSDEELQRPLKNGWTVASVLVHLAFWDSYYVGLLEQWERTGFVPSPANAEAINASVHSLSLSVPPRMAIQLARTAADSIDRKVEGVARDLAMAIEAGGYERVLRRALHRREHLDQLERLLSTS